MNKDMASKDLQALDKELPRLQEKEIIGACAASLNDWVEDECPIRSVTQKQLDPGESIPDGTIRHENNNEKKWVEVTRVSSSPKILKEINLLRKGLKKPTNRIEPVQNLTLLWNSIQAELASALSKKCKKSYTQFESIAGTNGGILIIMLDTLDLYVDENAFSAYCNFFDKHVLFSCGCGNSDFEEIVLSAFVLTNEKLERWFVSIANSKMMARLKARQRTKDEMIASLNG